MYFRIKALDKNNKVISTSKLIHVATKGIIKARAKGKCYVYIYAQNGVYKRVRVIVK